MVTPRIVAPRRNLPATVRLRGAGGSDGKIKDAAATASSAEEVDTGTQGERPASNVTSRTPSPMPPAEAALRRADKRADGGVVSNRPLTVVTTPPKRARSVETDAVVLPVAQGKSVLTEVTIPAKFNVSPEMAHRIVQMIAHTDDEVFTYAISHLPSTCTWGWKDRAGNEIRTRLTTAQKIDLVNVWTVAELRHWGLGSDKERFTVGYMPLRDEDFQASQRLLAKLSTVKKTDEDESPVMWASRWARVKRGGPRVEFEELYDLREPLSEEDDLQTFYKDSLMEGDIVLIEAGVSRYKTKGEWQATFDLQAIYWLCRPERAEEASPAKKVKGNRVRF